MLFRSETVRSQTRNIARAKERATEFIDWYKANYWSFKELKAAKYDDEGKLVKLDRDELGKYVHALKQSNYLTPDLLKSLETTFDQRVAPQGSADRQLLRHRRRDEPDNLGSGLYLGYQTAGDATYLIGRESECHGQRYRRPMDDRLLLLLTMPANISGK